MSGISTLQFKFGLPEIVAIDSPSNHVKYASGAKDQFMSDRAAEHHPGHIASQHETGVLVGWTHVDLGSNIELRLQSAQSRFALENGEHVTHNVLMTNNQALLLAKFLLDATQQTLPARVKPSLWWKVRGSIR